MANVLPFIGEYDFRSRMDGVYPGTTDDDYGHPTESRLKHSIRKALETSPYHTIGVGWITNAVVDSVAAVVQGTEVAGDILTSVLGSVGGVIYDAVTELIGIGGYLFDVAAEMLVWMLNTAKGLAPLLDPSTNLHQKLQTLTAFDPTSQNSAIYHLFMDAQYEKAANAVAILLVYGGFAVETILTAGAPVAFLLANPQIAAVQISNLTIFPSPYLSILRQCLSILHDKPTGTNLLQRLYSLASLFSFTLYGASVSFPTALTLGIQIIGGLPNPNPAVVIPMVFNDTVFRNDMKTRFNVFLSDNVSSVVVDQALPAISACFSCADADKFLTCAEKAVDITFPSLVRKLRNRGVSLSDARVVISALWHSNGQIGLAFDQNTTDGKAASKSLLALGVAGVVTLAEVFGQSAVTSWFSSVFGPIIPAKTYQNILKAIKFITLCAQAFNEWQDESHFGSLLDNPSSRLRIILDAANSVSWDINKTLILAKAQGGFDGLQKTTSTLALFNTLAIWATTESGLQKTMHLFCDIFTFLGIHPEFCNSQAVSTPSTTVIPSYQPDGASSGGGAGGVALLAALAYALT